MVNFKVIVTEAIKKRIVPVCKTLFFAIMGMVLFSACNSAAKKMVSPHATGRNDTWEYVGYGGGGASFAAAVSPFNPQFAMVASDMTGSFVTYNGGDSWRMFNMRGVSKFFVFDPVDSNTVYANSIALFKSTDRGNSWQVVYPSEKDIKTVISKGDHGDERVVTHDHTVRKVIALAIDPKDSKKLFAAISIDGEVGLYISTNGGEQWSKERRLPASVQAIFINPASPLSHRTIYIAAKDTLLVKENEHWKNNSLPAGVSGISAYSAGFSAVQNKFIIYGIAGQSYYDTGKNAAGIYYTSDGGGKWINRQDDIMKWHTPGAALPQWRSVATSANHPERVYVSYNELQIGKDSSCFGVAVSNDFGITWKLAWKDAITAKGMDISPNFKSGWLNERYGPMWGENPLSMGVAPNNPDVCITTDLGRTVKTQDGGNTWEQAYTKKVAGGWASTGLDLTTVYGVVFNPFNSNHVYNLSTDVGLMESKDGGKSWNSATNKNGVPAKWVNTTYWLSFDPEVKDVAWSAMCANHDLPRPKMWRKNGVGGFEGGLLKTTDGGKSWNVVSQAIGEAAFTHILVDPYSDKNERTLYASAFGKGVYKSIDGGITWKQKNKGIEGKEPFAWRILQRPSDKALFLIVNRRSEDESIGTEKDGALYMSVDGAENWTKLSLPHNCNAPTGLAFVPGGKGLILSAWGRPVKDPFSGDMGGGIFLSTDNANTWAPVLTKDQHVHDISFDVSNNTYYACTFNGSTFKSGDGGNTWKRLPGYNFKWGKRIDFDPRHPGKIFISTYGGGVWYGANEGDDKALEDIVTPVFRR